MRGFTEGTSSTRPALSVARMLVLPASKSVPVQLPNTRVNFARPHGGTVGAQMEFVKIDNPFVRSAQLTGSTSEPRTQSIESVTNQLGITNQGSLSWLSNFENSEGQIGNIDAMSTRPCYQSGRHDHITKEEDLDAYSVQQTPQGILIKIFESYSLMILQLDLFLRLKKKTKVHLQK